MNYLLSRHLLKKNEKYKNAKTRYPARFSVLPYYEVNYWSVGGSKIRLTEHFHQLAYSSHLSISSFPHPKNSFSFPSLSLPPPFSIFLCIPIQAELYQITLVFQIYCWLQNIIYNGMDWFFKIYPCHGLISSNHQISLKISTGVNVMHSFLHPKEFSPYFFFIKVHT